MICRTISRVALASLFLSAASAPVLAVDIRGVWQSSEGVIDFVVHGGANGEATEATYGDDGGHIVGSFTEGRLLRGHWMENSSAVRCATPILGPGPAPRTNAQFWYWGTVELGFSDGGFSGRWDYCGQGGGAGWVGNR